MPVQMPDLPPLAWMHEEHEAWLEMCKRLKQRVTEFADSSEISPNINDESWSELIDQIKYWGEALHQLRLADPQYDAQAYTEAKTNALQGRS